MLPGDHNVQGGCYRHHLGSSFGGHGIGRLDEWGIAGHHLTGADFSESADPDQTPETSGSSRILSFAGPEAEYSAADGQGCMGSRRSRHLG